MVKNKKSKKKMIIIALFVLLVAVLTCGLYYYFYLRNTSEANDVSLTTATKQEKAEVEENKEEITRQEDKRKNNSANSTNNSSSGITVTITSATIEGVYAFITGVLEDGGTCTATYSKGSDSFKKMSKGFINVNDTQCEPIQTNREDFNSTGIWNVSVTYSGAASQAKGTSQASTITIQ